MESEKEEEKVDSLYNVDFVELKAEVEGTEFHYRKWYTWFFLKIMAKKLH